MATELERRSKENVPLRALIDVGQRMSEALKDKETGRELRTLWQNAVRQFHRKESCKFTIN